MDELHPLPVLDDDGEPEQPSAARIYDYLLGGSANFAIDREAAERLRAIVPDVPLIMQANRAFLRRAVQFLVAEGIEQFLDLGSGIPTVGNVHEIAQASTPTARVVYVDLDPVAIAHSHAILRGNPHATAIRADARQAGVILAHPEVRRLLDLGKPVGLLLAALLHFVTDDAAATHLVSTFRDALAPGSYLVLSHGTAEGAPPELAERSGQLYARSANPTQPRSHDQVARFFAGWALVAPGLVYAPLWRPDNPGDPLHDRPARAGVLAGVGRKP